MPNALQDTRLVVSGAPQPSFCLAIATRVDENAKRAMQKAPSKRLREGSF
jgi:hypothetical protein